MPAMPPPVDSERDGLVAYVAQQLDAFRSVAFGLTDARAHPERPVRGRPGEARRRRGPRLGPTG